MTGFAKANTRIGYTQVEPNHMSGIITGQILAQLPVDTTTMGSVIEQGRFAKYDYKTGKVNLTGKGEWMMIYNEEKLPDPRKTCHKDFAMVANNYTDKEIVPRLISVLLGDIFTTNAINAKSKSLTAEDISKITDTTEVSFTAPSVGTVLKIDTATGYLAEDGDDDTMQFEVVKVYNLADQQPAVKVMRIK